MNQFKQEKAEAENLNVISRRAVAQKWVAPAEFSFGIHPPDNYDIYKTYWFTRRGFRWWLVTAAGHLEHCIEEFRVQKKPRIEAIARVEDELAQLDATLKYLKIEQISDELYARHLDDPEDEKPRGPTSSHAWRKQLADLGKLEDKKATERDKNILAKKSAIDHLKYDQQEHLFIINRAGLLIDRNSSILELVMKVLKAIEDKNESILLSSMQFSQGLYYVCSVQGLGAQIIAEIDSILADSALHNSDRVKIMNSSELHQDWETSGQYYHNLLIQTLDKAVLFQSDLKDAKKCMLYQFDVLNRTLDLAKSLRQSRKMGESSNRPSGRSLGLLETPSSSKIAQLSLWGKVHTYEQAVSILSRGSQDPYQDPGWLLRRFFVSPDVAPHFQRIHKMTQDQFLELTNSFSQEDFQVHEIEAFLKYCTVVGDLFILSGDHVSAYRKGWELIDEMPIDPTPRSTEFAKPAGLDDMFSWLVRNQKKCSLVTADRNTTEAPLLHTIRMNYPRGNNFPLEKLQDILAWCDKSGQLYRYTDKRSKYGEITLRRIDNGWGPIDVNQKYDAVLDPKRPEPYFQTLRSITQREDVWNVLREAQEARPINTEWQTYNALLPYIQVKRLSGNTIITRHRFHLYLRWCDQIGDGMSLRRDGKIT